MKNIIIGAGEVGTSLYNVLKDSHETYIRDIEPGTDDPSVVEVLNICFPPSAKFDDLVKQYQERYKPALTIIHSTVPVGTTRRLGAVHSPIHGKHPNLSGGIKTFVKYVGGENAAHVRVARRFLRAAGIKVRKVSSPEASELSKICCTTYYGMVISTMKEIRRLCEKFGADFDEVYGWNKHYNDGYKKLKMRQFVRPRLEFMPGKIGGHCVINNAKLMPDEPMMKYLLERNDSY